VNRNERGLVVLAVMLVIAVTVPLVLWADWFASNRFSNGASNWLGIVGGPSLLAALAAGLWVRIHRTCKVPWCPRIGEHEVAGTTWKVCARHHVLEHHERLFRLHQKLHPDRLGHGESHTCSTDTPP
jgi:hypothetical protein